jgi:hypothetical protein
MFQLLPTALNNNNKANGNSGNASGNFPMAGDESLSDNGA